TETPVKKALTRNAESKDYFTNAPWEYSNSPMGIYEKSIVEALQTKIILTNPEINIQPGAIVSQIYGSNSQKEALLLDKI
ncbi:MAG TPA: hypothetical protein DCX27_17030, partial [Balneola sp.]|nr:hypothetical protein [Balneola sp.]